MSKRTELGKIFNERNTFSGRFVRYGKKSNRLARLDTILLKDITDCDGKIVTDHLWFNRTKAFYDLGILNTKDIIIFDARVRKYTRSNGSFDYQLSYPTKLKLK